MRFITTTGIGGPDVMRLEQGFAPQIGPHDLLIEVYAAGVNRPDLMQRAGFYPPPPDASPIMGLEVAGVVAAVGDDIIDWHPGDRVCGLTNGGGYAEYVAVPVGQCLPIPGKLTFDEAAALPETFFTVWSNVFMLARLRRGDSFLVHGGSSGIGTMAIQLAARAGARVFTTAGTAAKLDVCRELQLVHTVDPFLRDSVTPELTYWRLHGIGSAYRAYTDEELQSLAARVPHDDTYVMFNNIPRVQDIKRFRELAPGLFT